MQAAAKGAAAGVLSSRAPHRGLGDALASIVRAEGLGGLYRGAAPNMLKIAVASAVQLAVFDGVKQRLQARGRRRGGWLAEHPGAAVLLAAMAAGLAVTAVVQPVDVVTTRLWNQPGALVDGGAEERGHWRAACQGAGTARCPALCLLAA